MPKYSVFLRDPADSELYELLPKSYSFKEELNKEAVATVAISFEEFENLAETYGTTVLAILSTSIMELYIERDGTKIFYGVLSDLNVRTEKEGSRILQMKAISFFGLFTRRIAGIPSRTFSSTDAALIAWTLIDESQTSDNPYSTYGITKGAAPTTVNRDRVYRFDNIKDAIVRLSNENLDTGFDFDIDTNKAFNVYYPTKGSTKSNIIFDEKTLSNYTWQLPLVLQLANKVYAVGEGKNDDVLYETRTAGTSFRDPFQTQEEVLRESDIKTAATLQAKGDRRLADAKEPIDSFVGQHYDGSDFNWDDYDLGDTIVINMPDLGMSSENKRVKAKEFKMEKDKSIGLISFSVEE